VAYSLRTRKLERVEVSYSSLVAFFVVDDVEVRRQSIDNHLYVVIHKWAIQSHSLLVCTSMISVFFILSSLLFYQYRFCAQYLAAIIVENEVNVLS